MPKIAGAMAGTPGTLRDDRPETALHIQADPESLSPKESFVTSSDYCLQYLTMHVLTWYL